MISNNDQATTFDGDNLYREETFTDRTVGTLRRMTPVAKDGSPDDSRQVFFVGQTQIMTPMGALPITFEIDTDSLAEAVAGFSDGAQQGYEETMKQLEEMRREQASSIVVPGRGGGVPGTATPKIQL